MMTTPRLREERTEAGFTTIELAVAMIATAILGLVMLTWIFSVYTADDRHLSNDRAIEDLRTVMDQLSREVRSSEHLVTAGDKSLSFWLDSDRDDVQEAGETVTWTLESNGTVVRATDAAPGAVLAQQIDYAASSFSYDSATPASIVRVTISLVADAGAAGETDTAAMETDVYLRNDPGSSGGSGTTTTTAAGTTTTTTAGSTTTTSTTTSTTTTTTSTTTTQPQGTLTVYKLKLKLDEGKGKVEVEVEVKDGEGHKIEGVTVVGTYGVDPSEAGYPFSDSEVTDGGGKAKFIHNDSFDDGTEVEFCVTDLQLDGHAFDGNVECESKEWDD